MTIAAASTPVPRIAPAPGSDVRRTFAATAPVVSIRALKIHCATCSVREVCLPLGLTPAEVQQVDVLVAHGKKLRKGESLYRAGDPFGALYATRIGSLKTTVLAEDGREQVSGYHMLGDILGLDGIATDHHGCEAVALEDTEVCVLPFARLEALAREVPGLQHNLYRFLSREISHDQNAMLLLGSMRAEERLAVFLLDLSARYHRHGYSAVAFVLRLTRAEIGSYLGLKLETVSRLFSRFHDQGLVQVQGRAIKLIHMTGLRQVGGRRD